MTSRFRGVLALTLAMLGVADTSPRADVMAGPASTVPSGATRVEAADSPTVVLLHGLGRTAESMRPVEDALTGAGYRVVNLGYPSRDAPIPALVDTVAAALDRCCGAGEPVHFVTHSLGGILVRGYADRYGAARVGRVIMLSPPNHGSEVVDRLVGLPVLEWVLGPAAEQLGVTDGVPTVLGPPEFELGIITGDASVNPLFSWWIPGPDDGKVSVESARLDGADAFLVLPYTHTFIMRKQEVIDEILSFLETGAFGN